jgi:RNA polymerase sigma-70 factor (ECF subfamily)
MAATFDTATMGAHHRARLAGLGPIEVELVLRDVYEQHHDRLIGYFMRRTHDRPLSEDLAHDTILRFASAVDRFDWDRPVWPYLTATANNLLIDHRRRDHREVSVDMEADPSRFERHAAGHELDQAIVLGSVLDEALSRLSDRQRVAVELRCRRGWSVDDAAEFLGIPPGTFNQLLYRARENLRARLDQVGARAAGVVLPCLTALRLRQRPASERFRGLASTPGAAMTAEGLVSVVMATAMALVVAAGAPTSGAMSDAPLRWSVAGIAPSGLDVVPSVAPMSDVDAGSVVGRERAPTASTSDVPEPAVAPRPDTGRSTVIEAPEAVPDSDGRVTVDEGKEYFVVSHELDARTGLTAIGSDNDGLWVDCDDFNRKVLCDSEE